MLDAALHLRLHRFGVLIADGVAHAGIQFVTDPRTGELVFPADGSILNAEELVLFVPEESPDDHRELQLLLTGRATKPGAATDRWMAYHGTPRWGVFLACQIHGVRFDGRVLEEAEIVKLNEPPGLDRQEGLLLRRLNSDRARLRAACRRLAQAMVPEPFAVGVDKHGVDVRASFGIVRLDWGDSTDAAASVEQLLGSD